MQQQALADEEPAGGYDPIAAAKVEELKLQAEKQKVKSQQRNEKAKKTNAEKAKLLPANMAKQSDEQVCINAGAEWRNKKTELWRDEIDRRNIKYSINALKNKELQIGGYECDIFLAYGLPIKANRHVNQYGTRVQFVYNRIYIYTENGLISSWSD